MRRIYARAVVALVLASCTSGGGKGGGEPGPLAKLAPTAAMPLSPGNVTGQDEDPSILVARSGDALYAAWYSNRAGLHPNGRERKEIFAIRSADGLTWTGPSQVTSDAEWSFYPSLAQSADGVFHLSWIRWTLIPAGCVPNTANPCTGYTQRILYNRSADGLAWNTANEVEIAGGPDDELASIVAASDGRLLVYFDSSVRNPGTKDIFVAVHHGTTWDPPVVASGVNSDTMHDTFPHVVERAPGSFLMTWTQYPTADPLFSGSSETMLSTSSDGLNWTAPIVASGPAPSRIDVFPYLYPDHSRQHWFVLWVTENGSVQLPIVDPLDPANLSTRMQFGLSGNWTLAVRPAPDFSGEVRVALNATDLFGEVASSPAFTLRVRQVPDRPTIEDPGELHATEGERFVFTPRATDPDMPDDVLTWSDVSDLLDVNATTGAIDWTPGKDQIGTHRVQVIVTDRFGLQGTMTFAKIWTTVWAAPGICGQPLMLRYALFCTRKMPSHTQVLMLVPSRTGAWPG